MSIDSAKQYLEKLQSDEAFSRKVREAAITARDEVIKKNKMAPFAEDEFQSVIGELSDEMLDKVAGGIIPILVGLGVYTSCLVGAGIVAKMMSGKQK